MIYGLWLALAAALMLAMRFGIGVAVGALAAVVVFWAAQAVFAAREARQAGEARRGWFSRPLGLVAFYVAASLTAIALRGVLERYTVGTFAMPSGSMTPTVLQGDWFVVARGSPIERGAVVIHDAPPGKDPLLKRVVGVAGDTVEVRDGHLVLNGEPVERQRVGGPCSYENKPGGQAWREEPCVDFIEKLGGHAYHAYCTPSLPCGDAAPLKVPPGHVFVLGDHRDHSADSRVYGPVPEKAVMGRALYVYFSLGPSGVRWDRIGRTVR